MIRTLILSGALALGLVAVAQADGFEPGREPGLHRHHSKRIVQIRRTHHVRRHVVRRAYGRSSIAPGGLTQSLNVPIYNIPPRRFP